MDPPGGSLAPLSGAEAIFRISPLGWRWYIACTCPVGSAKVVQRIPARSSTFRLPIDIANACTHHPHVVQMRSRDY